MEKLCSSEGRIGKMQYFLRLVLSTLIVVVVSVLIMFINEQAGLVVYYILIIPTAVFQIIQAIKRFHDMGKSGAYCWLFIVPLANVVAALILIAVEGDKEENKYGEPVK